jgi:hypothetical protein
MAGSGRAVAGVYLVRAAWSRSDYGVSCCFVGAARKVRVVDGLVLGEMKRTSTGTWTITVAAYYAALSRRRTSGCGRKLV